VLPDTRQLDKAYASDEIARTILSYCDPKYLEVITSELATADSDLAKSVAPQGHQASSAVIQAQQNVSGVKQ
jgi:hypothetical protein